MRKKIILIFIIVVSFQYTFSQSGWFFQNPNVLSQLNSVYYVNRTTGYVVGDGGTILKTTNQGNNWNISNLSASYFFWGIHFINENTGTAVGGYSSYTSLIIRTTDGGLNWTQQASNANVYLRSVFFIDANTGMAAGNFGGSNGKLIRTTNQGNDWTIINFNTVYTGFNCVKFINTQTGFVTSNLGVFKSTDAGLTWNQSLSSNKIIMSIDFIDLSTGYCSGYDGVIYKTINGGTNWITVNSGASFDIYSIHFRNANTGTIVGSSGFIYHTTNGGTNWTNQTPASLMYLGSLFYINGDTATAVGTRRDSMDRGAIIKTFTDGMVGIENISQSVPAAFSLYQIYPNPFNPSTKIKFSLPNPSEGGAMDVKLVIYDALGREVSVLVNEQLRPGTYEVDWNAANFSSGIYFYKITSGDFTDTKKMILMK